MEVDDNDLKAPTALQDIATETEKLNTEKRFIAESVRRWGGLASTAALDPNCKIFSLPGIDGIFCYRLEFKCAIVFGDPICSPQDMEELTKAFHRFCHEKGWSIIYITVSKSFASWAIKNVCNVLVEFGEEMTIDPHADPKKKEGGHARLVRKKVRHALNEGAAVQEYPLNNHNPQLEHEMTQVGIKWLAARQGPQIHIAHLRLFEDRIGKRWFYAKQGERVIGVLVLNQLQSKNGWLFNHLLTVPDAPSGTPELLVTTALDALHQEECHFVTFGAVPGEKLGEIIGISKFSTWLSKKIFQASRKIFNLGGRKAFWEKFHAESETSYLLFSEPYISIRQILALMRALNVSL